jgi:hypothetical protein
LARPEAVAQGVNAPKGPEIPVKQLALQPAPAPVPALRYRLLPELRDTTPGNAALLYYRAFAPEWLQNIKGNAQAQQKIDQALEMPLDELRKAGPGEIRFVRDWVVLKEVDRAARRSYCDWEMTPRVREDGIALLLPDVQSMRDFARYLAVRARLELADGQFDQAAHTLQTGLQMGRHVGDAPTLIQALVGAAISTVMLNQVEEWVRLPDGPNLYWALTNLPQPFMDLRKPLEGERIMIDSLLPGVREVLADPKAAPLAPAQLQQLMANLARAMDNPQGASLFAAALAAKKYGPAKEFLRAQGRPADQVEALPVLQAVLMYEVATYDRLFEELQKLQGLPYRELRPRAEAAVRQLKEEVVRSGSPGFSLAGYLLPAIDKVPFACVRIDRRINALRCVEAIRLHAAAHGQLPNKLADVTAVPIPDDPVTSRPFEYTAGGGKATLTAPPPAGESPHEGNSLRYEITLRR